MAEAHTPGGDGVPDAVPHDVRSIARGCLCPKELTPGEAPLTLARIERAIMADRVSRHSRPDHEALIERLREALEELVDTLAPAEREPIQDPMYGDEVRRLGLRIGFGALMATASYEWRAWLKDNGYPLGSEFVAGPCRSVLQSDIRSARVVLASPDPIPKAADVSANSGKPNTSGEYVKPTEEQPK